MENYEEKLKNIINSKKTPFHDIDILVKYFPELKEDEDEKIRKAIADLISEQYTDPKDGDRIWGSLTKSAALTWLEKQGIQKEQKPVEWSEEDENMINVAIDACSYMIDNFENSTKQYEDASSWLKSLKDKVISQSQDAYTEIK